MSGKIKIQKVTEKISSDLVFLILVKITQVY